MVIACEHCNTRFQLDDARVPEVGVRVRCSRCKHAFFVAPPGGTEEAVHAAAADAAAQPESSAPPPTEDLPPPAEGAEARSEAGVEEDWQFNIPESGASDPPAAGDVPPSALGPAAPVSGESLPLPEPQVASDPPEQALEALPSLPAALPEDTSCEPETASGDLRDELFGDPASSVPPEDAGAETGSAADQLFGSSDGHLGADEDEIAAPAPEAPVAPQRQESLADLGSPEDWDFVGDTPLPGPQAAAAPVASADEVETAAAAPAQQAAEPAPAVISGPVAEAPRWAAWLDAAGWLACAALFVAGVAGVWSGSPEPSLRTAPAVEIGPLRLQDLRAAVVENLHAGSVWVFRGTLVNPQAEAASAGALPRLALLDDAGEVVGEAWFGRSPSDVALRERKPAEVAPGSRAASSDLARRTFVAGEQLELTAIVERLPDRAVAWRVDPAAVASGPTAARSSTPPSLPSSRE